MEEKRVELLVLFFENISIFLKWRFLFFKRIILFLFKKFIDEFFIFFGVFELEQVLEIELELESNTSELTLDST